MIHVLHEMLLGAGQDHLSIPVSCRVQTQLDKQLGVSRYRSTALSNLGVQIYVPLA